MKLPILWAALLFLVAGQGVHAQAAADPDRYDDTFRKYSKRFFGVGFDWQYFKAQGLAESGLDPSARSRVGARGVMQLMPGTYAMIKRRHTDLGSIDDPEWNIAAGIMHSRGLWHRWNDAQTPEERLRFMFGSYNAGEGTILRAKGVARTKRLEDYVWTSIETVAPDVPRWRYRETLPYVRKIEDNHKKLKHQPRKANAIQK